MPDYEVTDEYGNVIENPSDDDLRASDIYENTDQFDLVDSETGEISSYDEVRGQSNLKSSIDEIYAQIKSRQSGGQRIIDADTGLEVTDYNPSDWEDVQTPTVNKEKIIDIETGEEVKDYNPADWEDVREQSFSEATWNRFKARKENLEQGYYGTKQYIGEQFPFLGIDVDAAKQEAVESGQLARDLYSRGYVKNKTLDTISKTLPMIPEAAVTMGGALLGAAAAPAVGLGAGVGVLGSAAVMGARQFGETFGQEYSNTGKAGTAGKRASADAIVDFGLSFIPGAKGATFARTAAKQSLYNASTMLGGNYLASATRDYTEQKDIEGKSEVDYSRIATKAYKDTLSSSGETLLLSGLMGTGGAYMSRGGKKSALLDEPEIDLSKLKAVDAPRIESEMGNRLLLEAPDAPISDGIDLTDPNLPPQSESIFPTSADEQAFIARQQDVPVIDVPREKFNRGEFSPIIEAIAEEGGINGRRGDYSGGEFDGKLNMETLGAAYKKVFSQDAANSPDTMFNALKERGLLSESDTVDTMWDKIRAEAETEVSARKQFNQEQSFVKDGLATTDKNLKKNRVNTSDLMEGDELTVKGEKLKVEAVTEDGAVKLRDGDKYGEQVLPENVDLFVEDFKVINELSQQETFESKILNNLNDEKFAEFTAVKSDYVRRKKLLKNDERFVDKIASDLSRQDKYDTIDAFTIADKAVEYKRVLQRKLAQSKNVVDRSDLRAELDRLNYLPVDYDLLGRLTDATEVNAEIFRRRQALFKNEAMDDTARDPSMRENLDRERISGWNEEKGAINLQPIADWFDKRKAEKGLLHAGWDALTQIPEIQNKRPSIGYGKGEVFGKEILGLSEAMAFKRKYIERPKTLANNSPDFKRGYDPVVHTEQDRNLMLSNMFEKVLPAVQLDSNGKKSLNKIINYVYENSLDAQKRGESFPVTRESIIAAGATPEVADGYFALRQANDLSFDIQREAFKQDIKNSFNIKLKEKIKEIKLNKENQKLARSDLDILIKQESDKIGASVKEKLVLADMFFDQKKLTNYFPAMREGNLFLKGKNPVTGEDIFYLAKDKKELANIAGNLKKRGFKLDELQRGEILKEVYDNDIGMKGFDPVTKLELNALMQEVEVDGKIVEMPDVNKLVDGKKFRGFRAHLLNRKGVEGYNQNFIEANLKYLEQSAAFASRLKHRGKKLEALNYLKDTKQDFLYQQLKDLYKETDIPNPGLKAAMEFTSHYHMGFGRLSSGLIDYLGTATVTIPEISKLTWNVPAVVAKSTKLSTEWMVSRENFVKKYPDLAKALDYETRIGTLGAGQVAGLTGDIMMQNKALRKGMAPDLLSLQGLKNKSMFFKKFADEHNRLFAYISAWEAAPKNVMDKAEFAREFVGKTQALYGAQNRPRIGRGLGRPFYQMKEFTHNYVSNNIQAYQELFSHTYQRLAGKDLTKEQRSTLNKMIAGDIRRVVAYPAALLVTGGLRAMPGVETISTLLSWAGEDDLKDSINDKLPEGVVGDLMLAGILGVVPDAIGREGFSISGALNPGAGLGDVNKSFSEQAVQQIAGPLGGVISSASQAIDVAKRTSPARGARELLPPGIRNVMRAYETAESGNIKGRFGQDLVLGAKPEEVAYQAMGFPALRQVEANELENIKYRTLDKASRQMENVYKKLVYLEDKGDTEEINRMREDLRSQGVKIDRNHLRDVRKAMHNPEVRLRQNVPKRMRGELEDKIEKARR